MGKKIGLYILFTCVFVLFLAFAHLAGFTDETWMIYLVLILMGAGFIVFVSLDFIGFVGFVFFAQAYSNSFLKFEVSEVTLSPYTAGVIFLGGLALGGILLGRRLIKLTLMDVLILLVCAIYFISTVLAKDLISSGFLAFHALFIPVLTYFSLRFFVTDETKMDMVYTFYLWGIFIFAALVVFHFVTTFSRTAIYGVPPISAATMLTVPLVYLVYARRLATSLDKILAALCFVALFLTFSRAYLALVVASPVLWLIIRRRFAFPLYAVFFALTLVFTLTVSYSVPQQYVKHAQLAARLKQAGIHLDSEYTEEEFGAGRLTSLTHLKRSMFLRAMVYRTGIENFLDHPLFGVGLYQGETTVTQHNFHIEWLEYSGLAGFVLYAAVFGVYFWRFGRLATGNRFIAAMVLAQFFVLANAVTNGFMHGFFPYVSYTLFGFSQVAADLEATGVPDPAGVRPAAETA